MQSGDRSGVERVQGKIRSDIAKSGWSVIWVFDPDGEESDFAYTVGLEATFKHPEILLAGLPEDVSNQIINAVSASIEAGSTFMTGDERDDVLEGFRVKVRTVPALLKARLMVQAGNYYRTGFGALQLLWPDRDGNFPGEDGVGWLAERQYFDSQ